MLQCVAVYCSVLRRVAVCCSVLQRVVVEECVMMSSFHDASFSSSRVCVYVLQYVFEYTATHCNTLQHAVTRCNTLQHTVTHMMKRVV